MLNISKLMQDKQKMNFLEYVSWVFMQNQDSCLQEERLDLSFKNLKLLNGEDMGKVQWMFRKYQSQEMQNSSTTFFHKNHFIFNHIFKFLLTIIHNYPQAIPQQILRLMKSIGIVQEENELKLYHIENDELLQLSFEKQELQQLDKINQEDFKNLFKVILEIKEISKQQELKELKELNQQLENKNFNIKSIMENLRVIMFEIDSIQSKEFQEIEEKQQILQKKNKQKDRSKQSQKKQENQKQQAQQLKQETISFSKVQYRLKNKDQKNQILLFDGTIVRGKIWIPMKDLYCIPLSVSIENQVKYFNIRIAHLNEEIKVQNDTILSYQGPLNDQFDPNVIKDHYVEGVDGVLTNQNDTFQYQGYFQDGLFDGIGRMYKWNSLIYVGEFRVGMKHGFGKESFQNELFLHGNFTKNNKNGLFTFYKCIDYQTRDIKWEQLQNYRQKIYNKGNEVQYTNQPNDFLLQKKSLIAPNHTLLNYGDYGITNYQLKSLQSGRWLNSTIIDIVIQSILTQRLLISPNLKNNTIFVNCAEFQDIFGSLISKNQPIEIQTFKEIIKKSNMQYPPRFVFYFNLDRSHFLSVVYENEKLYLVDSLQNRNADLLYQIKKLLSELNYYVNGDWQDITISQQKNSFDCGIYTIYYVCQIIKNIQLSIPEMIQKDCFKIEQSKINFIRYLIEANFMHLGIELLQI